VPKGLRGLVAVGAVSLESESEPGAKPVLAGRGSALLAAMGAWLVGVKPAIVAVTPLEVPIQALRTIGNAGIDVTRIWRAESANQKDLEPFPEQLAGVGGDWTVHVCGMSSGRQRALLGAARGRAGLISVDTPGQLEKTGDLGELLSTASQSDAFLTGRKEAAALWPSDPPREILRILAREGVTTAVIKLGVGGSIGLRQGAVTWMPAFPIGAAHAPGGDAYAGAFAARFGNDPDLGRAMAWATAAASAVVESRSPLDLLTDFWRRSVESRARMLEADARHG
jgi:sugar/nucleoside kinase (ribokinase family)